MEKRIDSMGRIVIPIELRKQLKVQDGDPLDISIEGDRIILTPTNGLVEDVRRDHKFVVDLDEVQRIKRDYPVGTMVECIIMKDEFNPVYPGETGIVDLVDSLGSIHVKWDNGRDLALIVGVDKFKVIEKALPEDKNK